MVNLLLHKLAEKVFGAGWQSKLARHIETNPRTVRRWASGDIPTPKVVIMYLRLLIKTNHTQENHDGR